MQELFKSFSKDCNFCDSMAEVDTEELVCDAFINGPSLHTNCQHLLENHRLMPHQAFDNASSMHVHKNTEGNF